MSQFTASSLAAVRRLRRIRPAEWMKHIYLAALCALLFFPFLLMLQMSFKSQKQIIFELFEIKGPFHLSNYSKALKEVWPLVGNSFIMAIASVVLSVFLAALAGYAFARLRFPFKKLLFGIFFLKMLLPGIANLVPSYKLALNMGILDTYLPVVLFCAGTSMPFWVFVMRTFIQGQPQELFESMRIDGGGEWKIFFALAVPLMMAMVVLMSIQVFAFIWNDYIWPLVFIPTNVDLYPITVGLARLTAIYKGQFGILTAGFTLACIPLLILFVATMRHFVDGLTSGSIKM